MNVYKITGDKRCRYINGYVGLLVLGLRFILFLSFNSTKFLAGNSLQSRTNSYIRLHAMLSYAVKNSIP